MNWEKVYSIKSVNSIPDGVYSYCLILAENSSFALINAGNVKTYWLGLLNNRFLSSTIEKKKKFTVKLDFQHYRGFTIKFVTKALFIGVTENLKEDLSAVIEENPCLRKLVSMGLDINVFVREVHNIEEGKKVLKQFLQETNNFCPPASCGCSFCEALGGISLPTFIGNEEIC